MKRSSPAFAVAYTIAIGILVLLVLPWVMVLVDRYMTYVFRVMK